MTNDPKPILVVEDNPDDAELTVRALKKSNIANELVLVRNGAEALDYLYAGGDFAGRDKSMLPQVVLLDLNLPKVDGLQVLRRIRSEPVTKALPVVVLTSSDERRDVIESYELGVNSYVRKPLRFAEFSEAVRQLGLYWALINRTPQ